MTLGALRVSAIALSAAAFVLSSPLSAADAATVAHHYRHGAHPRVSHRLARYVAHGHAGHRHYVWPDTATFTAMVIIPARPSRPE